jgi:outer membrane protein TolC
LNQQIVERESQLNILLGRYPQTIDRDTLSLDKDLPLRLSEGLPSSLLRNRSDIREAEFELEATKADVVAARAAFYPSLTLTGAIGVQAFKTSLLFLSPQSIAYGIGGGLTAPLLNRSAIKSDFSRANSRQLEALYAYQKTVLTGYAEVYEQVKNIQNLELMYENKTSQVRVLDRSILTSDILLRAGQASYLEVLMAQQNALQAKLGLVEVRNRQYLSLIQLYKALGGGWK